MYEQYLNDHYRGINNPRYGKGEEFKGENNPMFGKEVSKETRDKISETRKNGFRNGFIKLSSKIGRGIKTRYKKICFRSTWEAKVAKYLDDNNIIWKYEEKRYILWNNVSYLPDFFIYNNKKELIKIIEVKGYVTMENMLKVLLLKEILEHCIVEVWDGEKMKELSLI